MSETYFDGGAARPRTCRCITLTLLLLGGGATTIAGIGNASGNPRRSPVTHMTSQQDDAIEYAKVQGAESCGECHAAETEAWKKSTHFATWSTMHRTDRAREIADALGISGGIKRNDLCFNCHYTATMVDAEPKPVSGVSCESCHGPGQDWIEIHSDYGEGQTAQTETAEHRDQRLAAAEAGGMLRPANLYDVARNCYECHTVPNEALVNVGGHPAGSDFELVAWSQGEVRHNYQYSEDGKNRSATVERTRVLYVVGVLTEFEYTIRAFGKATTRGDYLSALNRRKNASVARIESILEVVTLPEVQTLMDGLERDDDGRVKISRSVIAELPAEVSAIIESFVASHDGSQLAAVDTLLPDASAYHGTAHP